MFDFPTPTRARTKGIGTGHGIEVCVHPPLPPLSKLLGATAEGLAMLNIQCNLKDSSGFRVRAEQSKRAIVAYLFGSDWSSCQAHAVPYFKHQKTPPHVQDWKTANIYITVPL
jgi:hypothetical protein